MDFYHMEKIYSISEEQAEKITEHLMRINTVKQVFALLMYCMQNEIYYEKTTEWYSISNILEEYITQTYNNLQKTLENCNIPL